MTYADRIRSMSDEELAEERVQIEYCSIDGDIIPGMFKYRTTMGASFPTRQQAVTAELEWLKSEV